MDKSSANPRMNEEEIKLIELIRNIEYGEIKLSFKIKCRSVSSS